jgi:hypothetical protein
MVMSAPLAESVAVTPPVSLKFQYKVGFGNVVAVICVSFLMAYRVGCGEYCVEKALRTY